MNSHLNPADIAAGPPSASQERWRRLAGRLPRSRLGRLAASLLLRLAGGKTRRAFDVTVFDSQRARLHPYDNISEKRVYITPQFWDPQERACLADFIADLPQDTVTFLDIGANAGLYSLFAKAACEEAGKNIQVIAVEPDPVMRARLELNFDLSGASARATVLPWAITETAQSVNLQVNTESRGLNSINSTSDTEYSIPVEGHPLTDIWTASRAGGIDILKIDIEGAEYPALDAFFGTAKPDQFPTFILIEVSHEQEGKSAFSLCLENGYRVAFNNAKNAILIRED